MKPLSLALQLCFLLLLLVFLTIITTATITISIKVIINFLIEATLFDVVTTSCMLVEKLIKKKFHQVYVNVNSQK